MVVELNDLSCGYAGNAVLRNLCFSMRSGEAVCILGSNGIGKTTLFKTLLRFIKPISGSIHIDGNDIMQMEKAQLSQFFSYVPQAKESMGNYTVQDIVLMGRARYIRKFSLPSKEDYNAANIALGQLALTDYRDRNYSTLSGGEQQMVLLARAIAQNARFILLDEPASNLDFKNQERLLRAIMQLTSQGIGILMVSHSPDHALSCCDNSLLISKDGTYIFGPSDNVITADNLQKIYDTKMLVVEGKTNSEQTFKTCCLQLGGEI